MYVHGLAFYVLPAGIERGGVWWTDQDRAVTLQGNRLGNALHGGDGATVLRGLRGDDFLMSGGGRTTMDGGLGADVLWAAKDGRALTIFEYDNVLDSSKDFGMDVLSRISDDGMNYRIDLSGIDADPDTADNDSFEFMGNSAFGADATGQVRFEVLSTNRVVVLVSTDADPRAEMRMTLTGSTATPVADNFIL